MAETFPTGNLAAESGKAWSDDHARLHGLLRRPPAGISSLLGSGQKILIALSGGQDSLCLAKLLLDLRSRWQWQIAIAHCNHRWREDSDANAAHVQALAAQWQVDSWVRMAETPPRGEAQARAWRYAVLTELAAEQGCDVVVTGHTASDRAETLLYNLVRGSGADGLAALTWERPLSETVRLVRPLLGFTRTDTAAFCQRYGLPIWEDSTNQSRRYARNRLRLDVLPYLRDHLNGQAERHLAQTAELLQADVAYLEQQATALAQQVERNGKLVRKQLRAQPLALQRRVVRQFLRRQLPHPPGHDAIESVVTLLVAPNRSQSAPLPGGAIARVEGDWLVLDTPLAGHETS